MKKIFFLFVFLVLFPSQLFAEEVLKDDIPNLSILKCGSDSNFKIYTSYDIELLLSISNILSIKNTPLTTQWNSFKPPQFNSENFSEDKYLRLPDDIKRILFLCLTWNESSRLKLFVVPEEALENVANRLLKEKPWNSLHENLAFKANNMPRPFLKELVYIVLRANYFESLRGGFLKNKSLWFISWDWLTPNEKNDQNESN